MSRPFYSFSMQHYYVQPDFSAYVTKQKKYKYQTLTTSHLE